MQQIGVGLAPMTRHRGSDASKRIVLRSENEHLQSSTYRLDLRLDAAMSNLSVKRQRANTNGDTAVISSKSPDEYRKIIATFDQGTLRNLLLAASLNSSHVAALVVAKRNENVNAEKTRVVEKDDQVHKPEMDLETVGKTTPAKQARSSSKARINVRDM